MDLSGTTPPPVEGPHVFVPVSQDAQDAALVLIDRLLVAGALPDDILFLAMMAPRPLPDLPSGIRIMTAPHHTLTSGTARQEVTKRFKIAHWWRRALQSQRGVLAQPAHWYINHPESVPANYAIDRRDRLSLNLLPDGMLGQTAGGDPTPSLRRLMRKCVDTAASASAGFWWRHSHPANHLTRFEAIDYDRAYTFETHGLVVRAKAIVTLPRPDSVTAARPGNPRIAVIADQDLSQMVRGDLGFALQDALAQTLNHMDLDQVIYKRHPRYPSNIQRFRANLRHCVVEADDGYPVEEIVLKRGAGLLVSYYSTALMNARQPENLRKIAILPADSQTVQPSLTRTVRQLLLDSGCEIVGLDDEMEARASG